MLPYTARPQCVAQIALLLPFLLTEGLRRSSHTRVQAGKQWTVPVSETNFDYAGPYPEITRCRQELAASFPDSLWRNSTTPKYQVEAVLDIPVELVWKGVTNDCSTPHKVNVYYPVGTSGRVPLISHAHGYTNGGDRLDSLNGVRLFRPLAEEGFFVIAYQHGDGFGGGWCGESYNQMGQIEWLKTSSYASMIDFSNVGLSGYSMGGLVAFKSTSEGNTDVKAAVSIATYCGNRWANDCPVPAIPILVLSGSSDTTSPTSKQRERLNQMSAPSVLADMPMAHTFNTEWVLTAMQPLMKSMFRCYLLGDPEACSQLDQRGSLEDTCFGTTSWNN